MNLKQEEAAWRTRWLSNGVKTERISIVQQPCPLDHVLLLKVPSERNLSLLLQLVCFLLPEPAYDYRQLRCIIERLKGELQRENNFISYISYERAFKMLAGERYVYH